MPEIAGGFVAYRHRQLGIGSESDATLRQIYQASLSLLYKLLFVLYAEARNLLPIGEPVYWEESLTRMAQDFAAKIDRGQAISDATHATRQYDTLLALFRPIDQGDPSLSIPRYDGGLFNPASADNQFLAQHKLSDRAVACTVDILVRDGGQPVNYAYISVRNLGSIHESLLENKLSVVDAAAGNVTLVNDKGERKATGSYYTPDYIVDYIIQQTLQPILAERRGHFSAGIAVAPTRPDDTALLTRLVMKRCIYGVDLNGMAVELAKLSLWLRSFTVGAPELFGPPSALG